MIAFFRDLLEYNNHVNQLLITRFLENPDKTTERAILLQNHIINAHQIWNSRILKERQFEVFEIHSTAELHSFDDENYKKTLQIISDEDLSEPFDYANTKGQTFSNTIRDTIFHIINHSTYHRGQIAFEFRQGGIDPLVTDYIIYKRDQNI